jgi:hypothetical protein
MQTPILILMLAFGVPGANSCTAQQQSLPRVGQTPAPAAETTQHPVVADQNDGDDDDDAREADDDSEGAEAMAEQSETAAQEALELDGAQAKSDCQAKCQGQGSCQTGAAPQLGGVLAPSANQHSLTLGGNVVRLNEKDLQAGVQNLCVQPGSTVILETKNGKQVVLRTEGLGGGLTTNMTSVPTLTGLFAQSQPTPQSQDDRVRELEKRVSELEAQLRERDNPRGQAAPRGYTLRSPQGRAEAEAERARASELREHLSAQARDNARQMREQAEELRVQAEQLRRHALEQAEQYRMHYQVGNEPFVWTQPSQPTPRVALPKAPGTPEAPEAAEAPEAPPTGLWGESTPAPPRAMRFKTPKPPKPAKAPKMAAPEQAHELREMMEQMRVQMEEMRVQMKALRDELQNAPQREMR